MSLLSLSLYIYVSQFSFKSFSPEDDDYEGYNFSLSGKLSAVRIVFLNRFIQEVGLDFFSSFQLNDQVTFQLPKIWLCIKLLCVYILFP